MLNSTPEPRRDLTVVARMPDLEALPSDREVEAFGRQILSILRHTGVRSGQSLYIVIPDDASASDA